jgi:hypothetical protein
MSMRIGVMAAGMIAFAVNTGAVAAGGAEVPTKFHGAGCNLKYTYSRTPKGDAFDCVQAKSGYKEGVSHDNDNFIRINASGVSGVEWGCTVKSVKTSTDTEFTFTADCSDEGHSSAGTVTLLLRPGKLVIVDQVAEGTHIIDVYHLLDGLH